MRFAPTVAAVLMASSSLAGEVRGRVRLEGAAAPRPAREVGKDRAACGESQPDPSLALSQDGALADVVVFIEDGKAAEPGAPTERTLDQVGCRFVPHVQAARVGDTLVAINSDPVFHNVRGSLGGAKVAFNLAMPRRGQRTPVKLQSPGVIQARCDAGHPWMSAFIHVFDHPYFAVSAADGRFGLPELPAGRYTLVARHERFGERRLPIEVPEAGAAPVEVVFSSADDTTRSGR